MAKDTIKGVSVKIGADTSDFIKGLKSVDKEINQTQKALAIVSTISGVRLTGSVSTKSLAIPRTSDPFCNAK